jgi:hypothetical protein
MILKTLDYKLQFSNSSGFFNECTTKIIKIIEFINKYHVFPTKIINTSFELYNYNNDENFTYIFFQKETYKKYFIYRYKKIKKLYDKDKSTWLQYRNYAKIDYKFFNPIIEKYFNPTEFIIKKKNKLLKKYEISYENTLAVYFRGTDKETETILPNYYNFYQKIKKINDKDNSIKNILIQTDSGKFLKYIQDKKKKLKKLIIIKENNNKLTTIKKKGKDVIINHEKFNKERINNFWKDYKNKGIHFKNSKKENYDNICTLLPTFLIMSKCKYIICNSSNCSLWICLFRGHGKNIIQNYEKKWYKN